jgi:membrane protein
MSDDQRIIALRSALTREAEAPQRAARGREAEAPQRAAHGSEAEAARQAAHEGESEAPQQAAHGREAEAPQDIPPRGWKDVLKRSWAAVSENNIFLASGGVSYAVVVALFPALAALVAIYGLVMDPQQIAAQVNGLSGILPEETRQMLSQELNQLVSASNSTLGISAVAGVSLALWSASRGTSGMMSALNMAYEEKERRGFFKFNTVAVALTIGLLIAGIVVIALIAGLPGVVVFLGLGGVEKWAALLVQWPVLMVLMAVVLAVLYRYGPDREEPQWRWISPGAVAATLLWIVASVAFTVYVTSFSNYNKTYGSLGGGIMLLTWLYISAFAVLFGAVVNAQAEQQTRKDTTTGPPLPMGQRGAYAADRLGRGEDGG